MEASRAPRITATRRRDARVTALELFFDLVFVLALTQCTALMAHEPTWEGLAKGLLVLAVTSLTHANEFLGAFAAGVTLATSEPRAQEAFQPLGDPLSEILKLAALLLFAALISPEFLSSLTAADYAFAVLVLVVARPLAMYVSLLGSDLTPRETIAAGWFGPKGFASVFFGFLILGAGIPNGNHVFHLVAIVIAASIVAHSSTDVLVARWLDVSPAEQGTA